MNEDDIKEAAYALKTMVLNAAVFGDLLKVAKAGNLLGDLLAKESMSELEAQVLMSAADQFTRCIRTGMGINQALDWMSRSGWPENIGNHVTKRLGV